MQRHESRKLALAGMGAAAVAVLIAGAFLVQQIQLAHWQSRWAAMSKQVIELEQLEQQNRANRPWFDKSFKALSVLRALAEAFPEDGVVSAKSVEIRGASMVTCTGTARDSQSLLRTLDRLRALREVREVKVEQIRGRSPVQYSFNFQWTEATRP